MMEAKEKDYNRTILLGVYAAALVCFGLTRLVGMPIARMFDWAGYGQMRGFFCYIFTGILWIIEMGILRALIRLKLKERIFSIREGEKELLPGNRIVYITAICVLVILVISIQTGFRVKFVYDIGEKVTGYELYERIAVLLFNGLKMVWLTFLIRVVEALFPGKTGFSAYALLLLAAAPLGALDVFVFRIAFPLTYAALYLILPLIYLLVNRNHVKAFLLFLMLYTL